MEKSEGKGRLTRAWSPSWAGLVKAWPLNAALNTPINEAVQNVVGNQYLCAHSDLTEYLWRIEKKIETENVGKYFPAPKSYSYELRHATNGVIFAIAYGQSFLSFRIAVPDQAEVVQDGASPDDLFADDWYAFNAWRIDESIAIKWYERALAFVLLP